MSRSALFHRSYDPEAATLALVRVALDHAERQHR